MMPNAVKLAVTASVAMEFEFWTEDDGWKGACADLSVTAAISRKEEHGGRPPDLDPGYSARPQNGGVIELSRM
jgi:hypothetical protein